MRSALLLVLAASLGVTLPSDAKGTLNYKGKSKDFAITLKYAHLVKGPDLMDPKTTIRRVILSSTDLAAKIQACKTMDCSDDDLTDGIEIDITGGPRLLYWLAVNDGLVQYPARRSRRRSRPLPTPRPGWPARSRSTTPPPAAPSST